MVEVSVTSPTDRSLRVIPPASSPADAVGRPTGWILGFVRSRLPSREGVRDFYSARRVSTTLLLQGIRRILAHRRVPHRKPLRVHSLAPVLHRDRPSLWISAGCGYQNGRRSKPAASSRRRTSRVLSTASGESPCTQTESTPPEPAISTARDAIRSGSWKNAPGSVRGTSVPSGVYPRSGNPSRRVRRPAEAA